MKFDNEASFSTPMSTMKAVRIHACGGPEVLIYEDALKPEPAAVFPPRDAAKAHQMSQTQQARGKIVLQVV